MGLAYTIDTPIKVARFGITSAISIIEDNLIEMMRKYYYQKNDKKYVPISIHEKEHRARRITDYLNLINKMVKDQIEKIKASAFEMESDIVKYFEMLPEDSVLKQTYRQMIQMENSLERCLVEQNLKKKIKPGSIEVNIMTKVDKNNYDKFGSLVSEGSDALSALKGYAESDLTNSSVIFSAGMNPRLFNYLSNFREFDAKGWGEFDKKIIIKVSDYRSALIQGKYLAKKGLWVSEFRIESGLNCGGHAFATEGFLLGPILEEFKNKRMELTDSLFTLYKPAAEASGQPVFDQPHPIRLTAQGGIGTYDENELLHRYFGVDSTGWGTPFLLCPEATTVDEDTLRLLGKSREKDVQLSDNSPLGVRFNYLKGTSADIEKQKRIERGTPGSPCTEKFLEFNTEFTDHPICTASHKYQKIKIKQLQSLNLSEEEYEKQVSEVVRKDCLCIGLSNSAALRYKMPFVKNIKAVTICPGPNIAYFSKVTSLQEMTDHIYGRTNIIEGKNRPDMFIKELQLYVDFIKEKINDAIDPDSKFVKYCSGFCQNLFEGISYYRKMLSTGEFTNLGSNLFEKSLNNAEKELQRLLVLIPGYSVKI